MVIVMPSSANADRRVAKPSRIRTGKRCSAVAARVAAISGGTSGKWYSSLNRSTTESDRRGQPRVNSRLTMSTAKPCIFVSPDFQNTAAMEKRATNASSVLGIRCTTLMNRRIRPAISPASAVAVTLNFSVRVFMVFVRGGEVADELQAKQHRQGV